ncbi:MAG TPA: 3'-5' exonuclease [Anaeromyxobacteraceae bacterium]|nr:3'-5' exonuclease [Anaeromyxobacteraceae bacterium]
MLWFEPAWDSHIYWAVDLETGGFDPKGDPILSVGMVPIRGGSIRVGEAWTSLVRPEPGGNINSESITAHHLVPADVANAPTLREVLTHVDVRLRGGVLLVHQASIDVGFLRHAYATVGMEWPKPAVVDTVDLLVRVAKRSLWVNPSAPDGDPELNLNRSRKAFGLPDYGRHDALTDAISTGELFLVLRKRLGAKRLGDLR